MIFGEASTLASVLVLSHFNAACNFFVLPLLSLEEIGKKSKPELWSALFFCPGLSSRNP